MIKSTERLVVRTTRTTQRQPHPPRELRFDSATNLLTWMRPAHGVSMVTHYRIRIDSDSVAPQYEVPVGQSTLQLTPGVGRVFISSYNQIADLESSLAWLFISPGGGGGGDNDGSGAPTAPPVKIGSPILIDEHYDGKFEVTIPWTKSPLANSQNFKGVSVYVEDPDISGTPLAPMDGTTPMDGSVQMAGNWLPVKYTDTAESPVHVFLPAEGKQRAVRIYLLAYGEVKNVVPIRANRPNPTPNAVVTLPERAGAYVDGTEYAWLITNPGVDIVDDFDNPAGPRYSLRFSMTEPDETIPLPAGLRPYGGVQIVYDYFQKVPPTQVNGKFLLAHKPETWISDQYPAATEQFDVYFCSADVDQRVNKVTHGVTPVVRVSIVYPPDGGDGLAPDVGDLRISNQHYEWQPDGTIFAIADFDWTAPDSLRFSGVQLWVVDAPGKAPFRIGEASLPLTHYMANIIGLPQTAENWTVAAISMDHEGKLADNPDNLAAHTPRVTWTVGPPTALGNAPNVDISGASIVIDQQVNSDGVVMMRFHFKGWKNPTSNQFGGVSIARMRKDDNPATATITWFDAKPTDTELVTAWEPAVAAISWDFYFVSRDPQEHRNQILPGVTPKITKDFVPDQGHIIASRLPRDWFNTEEFNFPDTGQPTVDLFTAKLIHAEKIWVDKILKVGGGTGTALSSFAGNDNGQIGVFNVSNQLVGWIGQQGGTTRPDDPVGTPAHSVYGGWFKELYVGGDDPPTSPLYIDKNGVVVVGGWDSKGTRYPRISIRNEYGVEVGRMGAKVGEGLVPSTDPAYIAGAWLKELAIGGQQLSDWRILAKRAQTTATTEGGLVQFRNINNFTINYQANYAGHSNAACTLNFGYDVYQTDPGFPANVLFPGISITRDGTSHGALLINRGLVLNGQLNQRMVALVTYNGDPNGGDGTPFWGQLTMKSASNGLVNVDLGSGAPGRTGASYFSLRDENNNVNFSVDQSGVVMVRSDLNVSGKVTATGDVKSSGQVVGDSLWHIGGPQLMFPNGPFGPYWGVEVRAQFNFVGGNQLGVYNDGRYGGHPNGWNTGASGQFLTADVPAKVVKVVGGLVYYLG